MSQLGKTVDRKRKANKSHGSLADTMVKDTSTEMKTNHIFGTETTAAGHKLQTCCCGWSKVTLLQGIRIHQVEILYSGKTGTGIASTSIS